MFGVKAHVLIEQEHLRASEAHSPIAVTLDELVVGGKWGAARGQPDDRTIGAPDQTLESVGRDDRSLPGGTSDDDLHCGYETFASDPRRRC